MSNEWKEWSNHVLAELKRFDKNHESINSKLEKYNEALVRNTVTLEEHVRRTDLLEEKMEHVETEVDGLKSHMVSIKSVTNVLKFASSARGRFILKIIAGSGGILASYHLGLKNLIPYITDLFK